MSAFGEGKKIKIENASGIGIQKRGMGALER
jgi:hypothetical protein